MRQSSFKIYAEIKVPNNILVQKWLKVYFLNDSALKTYLQIKNVIKEKSLCVESGLRIKEFYCKGSGCGSVGRTIASNNRGLWFESSHR